MRKVSRKRTRLNDGEKKVKDLRDETDWTKLMHTHPAQLAGTHVITAVS